MVLLNRQLTTTLDIKVDEKIYSKDIGIYSENKAGFLVGCIGSSFEVKDICKENQNSYFNTNVMKSSIEMLCSGKVSLIETINVKKDTRGSGIGRKLLEEFIFLSRLNNVDCIVLVADILEDNKFNLVKWYSSFGFEVESYWDYSGYELPVMVLKLNN